MTAKKKPFWVTKSLAELTPTEWESLCDRCGRCCLHSVRDGKTGKIQFIAVACRFLEISTCRCSVYSVREHKDPDCTTLSPDKLRTIKRLPYTCAYRKLAEGRQLEWWHPLISGNPNTVHEAGISVQDKVISGLHVHPDDLTCLDLI
jgi:hypothetical protein